MSERDWVLELKNTIKRNRTLGTIVFYLTDLLYLNNKERNRFLAACQPGQRLLNLGAGFRASPEGFRAVDREAYPGVGLVADIGHLPFADDSVDAILCEVVLEHVPDAVSVIREMHRVVKPGGRVYLTIPFLFPYHASPHDYRRWTVSGVSEDFRGFETLGLGMAGGPTMALCNVLHEWLAVALSFNVDALYKLLYVLLIPLVFPWKLLDFVLFHYRHAEKIAALYYFHGRKATNPGATAAREP